MCVCVCWACVLGVWGVCVVCVRGVCGVCEGWAFVEWGCDVWVRGVVAVEERKYRSPLYYPDTLVNPDTCLGILT